VHNQADLTLCPSKFTQAQLQRQGFQRVKLWGRGVDTLRFNPRHRSEHWRRRLTGGYPQAPLLLYVGRLAVEKRVEWLRAVLQALPQARLAIVGDGPQRHQLEEIFSGTNTVFTGYLRGQDLAQAYASADVFVFPSANETLGNVILEAMASGLPIIAPSSGGQVDHVVDGWNGHLFDPNSPAHLSALAQRLVADPRHAHRLGMAARIYAESHGWQAVFDGLLNDYASLAKPCLPTGYYLDEIAAPTFQTY
jgi:glycosyltransferase involved in cell wall biosynthesis